MNPVHHLFKINKSAMTEAGNVFLRHNIKHSFVLENEAVDADSLVVCAYYDIDSECSPLEALRTHVSNTNWKTVPKTFVVTSMDDLVSITTVSTGDTVTLDIDEWRLTKHLYPEYLYPEVEGFDYE